MKDHAEEWCRTSDGAVVDLHTTVWGAGDHELVWSELSKHTEPLAFGPIDVMALDEPGRCLQVVLHWLHHCDAVQPRTDLMRALAQVADESWAQAAVLADRIGVGDPFLHGLLAHPPGVRLAGRLGLRPSAPAGRDLRLQVSGDLTGALTLERILGLPTWRARAVTVGRKVVPPPAYLRVISSHHRGDAPPMALLYLRHWRRQVSKVPWGRPILVHGVEVAQAPARNGLSKADHPRSGGGRGR